MQRINRGFVRRLIFLFLFSCVAGVLCASAQTVQPSKPLDAAAQTAADAEKSDDKKTAIPAQTADTNQAADKLPNATAVPAVNPIRVGVNAGQTTALSLSDAIRLALENNNDIEIARNDVRINETALRSLEGIYDPVFAVTPTFTRNTGARSSSGRSTNDFSLNLGLSQFLPIGGGRIEPFFNNSRSGTFFNSGANSFSSTTPVISTATSGAFFTSQLGVSYVQPLLRNRSIDNNRRNIRIQRKRLQQSDADFRRRTIENIANVQRSYWDLVFALRDQQNRQENLKLTRENMRRVEAQIAAGAAAPLARAEVATELANRESDLLLAAQNVTSAENILKQLLLKDPNAPEWTTQIVPTDQPSFDAQPVRLEDALAEAKGNRPELQRLNLQREINDVDIEFFKNQIKPQIDLNNTFSLNGFSQSGVAADGTTTTVPLIFGDATTSANAFLLSQINLLRNNAGLGAATVPTVTTTTGTVSNGGLFRNIGNLFNSNSPTYSVGVTIGFPLRNKSAKADLAGAQIQRDQLDAQTRQQEQLVIAEVRNAVQSVETARQRVLTARTARENAEVQLQGEQKLYEVGRSTTFLLFQRENALANARNAEIRSETDFNIALAELQRATSTTLRSNNIVVESLVSP